MKLVVARDATLERILDVAIHAARLVSMIIASAACAAPSLAQSPICPAQAASCCEFRPASDGITPGIPALGVHVWPSSLSQSAQAVDDLIALRPSHLRFGIGPNWKTQLPLSDGMTDIEMDQAVARGFSQSPSTGKFVALLTELRRRLDAKLHLVVWEPPPLPGERIKPQGRRLTGGNVDVMAAFLVAVLKYLADAGLIIDAAELSNEPDGGWNIRIAPRDYLALLRSVRQEAKRRAVTLPAIYGPGTSTITALQSYLADRDAAEGILDGVDVLSVHGWDDRRQTDVFSAFDVLLERMRALGRRPEVALTEYGIARPVPGDNSPSADMKTRAAQGMARSPYFASLTTRDLLRLYGRGIGTVISWEFQDPVWGKASYGLLDPEGKERPVYHALASVSSALRSDRATRFSASSDDRVTLMLGAFGRRLWIANPTRDPSPIVLDTLAADLFDRHRQDMCRSTLGRVGITVAAESVVSLPLLEQERLRAPQ